MAKCTDCDDTGIIIVDGLKTRCWSCSSFKGWNVKND